MKVRVDHLFLGRMKQWEKSIGNSLAVRWLGLFTSTVKGTGSVPGWETWKKRKKEINKLNTLGGFEWFKGRKFLSISEWTGKIIHVSEWEMTGKIIQYGKYWFGNVGVLIRSVGLGLMENRWSLIICKIVEPW